MATRIDSLIATPYDLGKGNQETTPRGTTTSLSGNYQSPTAKSIINSRGVLRIPLETWRLFGDEGDPVRCTPANEQAVTLSTIALTVFPERR